MAEKDPRNEGIAPPPQPAENPVRRSIADDDDDERTALSTFVPRPPPDRSPSN